MKFKVLIVLIILLAFFIKIGFGFLDKKDFDRRVHDILRNQFASLFMLDDLVYTKHFDIGLKETSRVGLYNANYSNFNKICNDHVSLWAKDGKFIPEYFLAFPKDLFNKYYLGEGNKCLIKLVDKNNLEILILIVPKYLFISWASDRISDDNDSISIERIEFK